MGRTDKNPPEQVPGIQLNYQDSLGATAAQFAAWSSKECVEALAGVAGVDWNLRNSLDWSPLFWAVYHGKVTGHEENRDISSLYPPLALAEKFPPLFSSRRSRLTVCVCSSRSPGLT